MGAITSRQNVGVEEVDISINHAYRYPPKSGNYFSSHFIMGGERFDTAQPEMYLFGENTDLNFLGSRPAPFPYPAPSASEPSRTLKALVNIRKESLRFVRVPDDSLSLKEPENRTPSTQFNIEFTFDCDVRCAITIMYFCTEEVTSTGLTYTPRDPSMNSETFHYKRGANQQFSQVCHIFDPSQYPEESLLYSFDREVKPIVIYCIAEEGEEPFQSHATIAVVERHSDGYTLKPLKQKLFVDGLCYLLQEIYGIENKNTDSKSVATHSLSQYYKTRPFLMHIHNKFIDQLATDDDPDDNGAECVICMCDLRDTLILPCRHLCLCNCCADSLRYQANNCPICRAPFRALLQIKALQKITAGAAGAGAATNNENGENVPPGYEAVSLIEALNGPSVAPQQPTAPPFENMYVQLPQSATDGGLDGSLDDSDNAREYQDDFNSKSPGLEDSTTQTDRPPSACEATDAASKGATNQMRMSVLMAQESEESLEPRSEESVSPPSSASKKKSKFKFPEDTVIRISETPKSKESSDGAVKKRHRKSSAPSPVSSGVTSASSFGPPEPSLGPDQAEDVEELTETLSLLEDSKSEQRLNGGVGSCSSLQESSVGGYEAPNSSSLPPTLSGDNASEAGQADGSGATFVEPRMPDYAAPSRPSSHVSRSCENEIGQEETPKERKASKKVKAKSNRSSGRKARTGSSSGYNPPPYESPLNAEESAPGLAPDSQSLPGTPLSHSSAISRSSDASVSSASSTRALIISHPSQSSTAI